MKVNETFLSIQGEGARAGTLNIFIRLADCDLTCGFCDTEFTSGKELQPQDLLEILKQYNCKNIIWTGGEPALQLKESIVTYFKDKGYYQAIETNGNNKVCDGIDYISLSPKVAEHVVKKNFKAGVNELRYIRHKGQLSLPEPLINAEHYFISPMFDGNHRLDALIKLKKNQVQVENFGKISKGKAVIISRQRNNVWFEDDVVKFAKLFADDVMKEMAHVDLEKILPEDLNSLENYSKLLDFNWNQFDNAEPPERDGYKTLKIVLDENVYASWQKWKERCTELLGYDSDAKCFEFAIVEALNIPTKSLK